jgi:hypothetical protein
VRVTALEQTIGNSEGSLMARPIEATPVLKGKDAKVFLEQIKITEPISTERKLWMARLVAEAKAAEK